MFFHRFVITAAVVTFLSCGASTSSRAESAFDPAAPYSPGKARALSFVPGLGQHYVGSHGKGWAQEAIFATGLVMVLTAGGDGGGGDGGGGGSFEAISRADEYGDYGYYDEYSGNGDGDGGRNKAMTAVGASCMVASLAWSVIDAPRTAERRNAEVREELGATTDATGPVFAWSVEPDLAGVRGSLRLSF